MGLLYALLIRIRKPVITAWDKEVAGPWDATVNSSADEAGWVDELRTELAGLSGFTAGGGLLDMTKFYELIDIPILIEAGERLNYDKRLLALAVEAYLGPA